MVGHKITTQEEHPIYHSLCHIDLCNFSVNLKITIEIWYLLWSVL